MPPNRKTRRTLTAKKNQIKTEVPLASTNKVESAKTSKWPVFISILALLVSVASYLISKNQYEANLRLNQGYLHCTLSYQGANLEFGKINQITGLNSLVSPMGRLVIKIKNLGRSPITTSLDSLHISVNNPNGFQLDRELIEPNKPAKDILYPDEERYILTENIIFSSDIITPITIEAFAKSKTTGSILITYVDSISGIKKTLKRTYIFVFPETVAAWDLIEDSL